MPPAVLLSCESITKAFGARPLFEGLSFGLSEGDRVGLIGPNGSGKSTFLRILAGTEEPDGGIRALRRGTRLGYVPQDPAFSPGRTVEEILTDALASDPAEEFEKATRVAVALGRAGFNDPSQSGDILSGGWKKRLAIAGEGPLSRAGSDGNGGTPRRHLGADPAGGVPAAKGRRGTIGPREVAFRGVFVL